jgi:transposase
MAKPESPPRRRSAREWARLIKAWEKSGKTADDFAAERGFAPRTLSWWKWRLAVDREPTMEPLRLVPVKIEPAAPVAEPMPTASWEIVTAGGHTLRVQGPMVAADVAAVLVALERDSGLR